MSMPRRISKEDLQDVRKRQVENLKFLDRFIKTMKWTKPQFAEKIGMTKASVYHWFKVDDMQLTTLNNAFDKIGYEVIFKIAPSYAERNGGYTRIIRTGVRRGDAAETAIIELVK